MYIVGVTGHSGSGKSEFTSFLNRQSSKLRELDLEKYFHNILADNKTGLIKLYGPKIFKADGSLDYNFYCSPENAEITDWVRKWIGPQMVDRFYSEAEALKNVYDIFITTELQLPSMPIWEQLDKRVFISSDEKERHRRLQTRSYLPCNPEEAKHRDISTEKNWANIGTDFATIHNDYTDDFKVKASRFLHEIIDVSHTKSKTVIFPPFIIHNKDNSLGTSGNHRKT